jgi:uncharacterized protein
MSRMLLWAGLDTWRAEACTVELDDVRMTATGVQLGTDPVPYRVDYSLAAGSGLVTRSLDVVAHGAGWQRQLALRRDAEGRWTHEVAASGGSSPGARAGEQLPEQLPEQLAGRLGGTGAPKDLAEALDCDLGYSPLTNTMPIRRHGLHRGGEAVDVVVAWVSVPDLGVRASRQRYEPVRAEADGSAVVRFVALESDFVAELVVDADGLVVDYPGLARSVTSRGADRSPSAD